ncbi:hypothetical protein K8B33_05235 [Alcanivorax sp. JB21]|uniref:hypothetical protein n=1 Tax=Alcanivorax limicola TaxID=2874102 RepID=UPI001CBC9125|nr:hypothetical protein [Alcanivorax limicola]MBZ2188488.1 hypothetical protein [Alcanivorax limicola]
MKDDISQKASSAYQAMALIREQAMEEALLEKRARQSSIKLESLLNEQTGLLREANERAAAMEMRAKESGCEARKAKRQAILANAIAIVALAFTAAQYFLGGQ